MKKVLLMAGLALLIPQLSVAESYITLGAGSSELSNLDAYDSSNAFKLGLGHTVHKYVRLEASLLSLGEFEVPYSDDTSITTQGAEVSAIGQYAIHPRIDLNLKLGLYMWQMDFKSSGNSSEDKGTNISIGAGTTFSVTETLDISVSYDQYLDLNGADIANIAVGINIHF